MQTPSTSMPPALELSAASRHYDSIAALQTISLRVEHGATCLVHGDNGSGKTTLLRVCAGLLAPTTGAVRASGRCLYLRPGSGARRRQTVHEVVRGVIALSGRERSRVAEALDEAGLVSLARRRVETLSSGQRGRLLVAIALAAQPAVACLDEPTAHLDEDGLTRVRLALRRLAERGTAVLVATHDRALLGREPDARLLMADGAVTQAG